MSGRILLLQVLIGVTTSVVAFALIEAMKERRAAAEQQGLLNQGPPGWGTV